MTPSRLNELEREAADGLNADQARELIDALREAWGDTDRAKRDGRRDADNAARRAASSASTEGLIVGGVIGGLLF